MGPNSCDCLLAEQQTDANAQALVDSYDNLAACGVDGMHVAASNKPSVMNCPDVFPSSVLDDRKHEGPYHDEHVARIDVGSEQRTHIDTTNVIAKGDDTTIDSMKSAGSEDITVSDQACKQDELNLAVADGTSHLSVVVPAVTKLDRNTIDSLSEIQSRSWSLNKQKTEGTH